MAAKLSFTCCQSTVEVRQSLSFKEGREVEVYLTR